MILCHKCSGTFQQHEYLYSCTCSDSYIREWQSDCLDPLAAQIKRCKVLIQSHLAQSLPVDCLEHTLQALLNKQAEIAASKKKQSRETLLERVELLEAMERNLESRMLHVKSPQSVLAHVANLRDAARELIEQADMIEASLASDCENASRIDAELFLVRMEAKLVRHFLRIKVYPGDTAIRRMLQNVAQIMMKDTE